MKRGSFRPRVAILGCGHVGRALASALLAAGRAAPLRGELLVWSRSPRSVRALLRHLRARDPRSTRRVRVLRSANDALAEADVSLLCVADDALVPLGRALARAFRGPPGSVVLVTNGYLPLTRLAALRRRGCALGRFHPLAPVPAVPSPALLCGAPFAIEGDPAAVAAARVLVRGLGGRALLLSRRNGASQAYHAGASLLGGGLVALFHLAERAMTNSVRSRRDLRDSLATFASSTLRNARDLGPAHALTGAVSRGSEVLVRGHLSALARDPEARRVYRLLAETMLELARARGSLDRSAQRNIRRLLGHTRRTSSPVSR